MRLTMIRNRDNERLPQSYYDFTAPGGTIGRDTNSTLILPDQSRAISRLQAIVHISPTGEAYITHRGSTTALILNGNPLPHNVQQPLAEGDLLEIAGYQFSVSLTRQPVSLAPLLSVPQGAHDIDAAVWDHLEAEFLIPPQPKKPLPDDPHHPLLTPRPGHPAGQDPLALVEETELASLHEETLDPDHLFTQDDPFSLPPILRDTTPSVLAAHAPWASEDSPSSETPPQANHEPVPSLFNLADELAAGWAQNMDHSSEDDALLGLFADNAVPLTSTLNGYSPLAPTEPEPLAAAEPPTTPPAQAIIPETEPEYDDLAWAEPLPDSLSWGDLSAQNHETFHSEAPADQVGDSLPPFTRLGVDPVRHQPFKPAKSASQEQLHGELLNAFVAGLGLDDAPLQPGFSPEQLYLAGKLLSLFSQGTVALLSSRSILKRGLKAEMTMILEEENNPFKMLPSGKTVLMQIFSTPMPGFTPPESAVRNAMIDLQAHQLGMIAGVRAIIAAMLQTFHPDTLEKMAVEQGNLPHKGMFSSNRKAALWDTLKAHYQRVANEVEDDFHTLFGAAFLHAYDLEIRQYKASQHQKAQR
ncbi:hypothetical protein Z042_16055 [Chania multitudinisentens RB-25]|uniref:FHA domain-containing protein n=1 Tax=Chania multitudinisentens RB-25 TaxID=1441930 RepID=W0LAT8_9GAMM|nr:type VI secretion system-associated FHA domain protein TagH [Chania multitudinisentens]AHG20948.1 hypothetical protein Z042_16055 [Chania multitudinisentens RB-25]